ncbi:MAG: alkaline phosphatase family protein [Nocardioides sp.]|nr:alkaline phosphatase family protein [Nocardioides sp.]
MQPEPSPPPTSIDAHHDGTVDKMLVLIVENHSLSEMQREMSSVAGLGDQFGYANNYRALTHPSLPNYLAIVGGDTYGVSDDDPPGAHPISAPSVFGAAIRNGRTAKVYADAMSSPCQQDNDGTYAVKHNTWAYFVNERDLCDQYDVPLTALAADIDKGKLPTVGMVIPDLCNDAHNCPLAQADKWLAGVLDPVLQGPDWASGRLVVVVTADEDDRTQDNQILTVVANPGLAHVVATAPLTHYSLARSLADIAGVTPLRNATTAPSLLKSFGLTAAR